MRITNFLSWVAQGHKYETTQIDEKRQETTAKIHAFLFPPKDCRDTVLSHFHFDTRSLATQSLLTYVHMRIDGSIPLANLAESGLTRYQEMTAAFDNALDHFSELRDSLRTIPTGTWEEIMIPLEKSMRLAIANYRNQIGV